jgi:general secretion pathway protein L
LLEDSLLQDPSDCLLVTAPGSAAVLRQGGSTLVAVCDKPWLRQALAPLQQAGLQIQRLLPEFTPVPAGDAARLFLLNHNGRPEAVLCDAASVWLLPTPSVPALQAAGALQVLAEPSAVSHSERWSAQPPRILTLAQRLLLATQSGWDMAQDEWAQNRRLRGWRRLQHAARTLWFAPDWRSARRSLSALLLVQLIGLNVWAWQEESQWAQRQHNLVQVFRQSFPAVTTVIDPVQQMRREVQTLRQQAGQLDNSDLESMLLALAAHWPEGATPETLDYQRGELRLGGLSDASQKQLAAHNWSADNYQWQMQGRIAVLRSGKTP